MKCLMVFILIAAGLPFGSLRVPARLRGRHPKIKAQRVGRRWCEKAGVRYHPGQLIQTDDDCEMCRCSFRGQIKCKRQTCASQGFCEVKSKKPGVCCPKCECSHEGYTYIHGESWGFKNKNNKCIQCLCVEDEAFCAPDQKTPSSCEDGFGSLLSREWLQDNNDETSAKEN